MGVKLALAPGIRTPFAKSSSVTTPEGLAGKLKRLPNAIVNVYVVLARMVVKADSVVSETLALGSNR